jgi:hypothetical protein
MGSYEGDYRCEVFEGGPCFRVAVQCWREPFTPSAFRVIACDEHAKDLQASGYHFDSDATAQLCRDVEREEELETVGS